MTDQSEEWKLVKKKVLRYRTLATFQGLTRLLLMIVTVLCVFGAVIFSFLGKETADQFCAIAGLSGLLIECSLYGIWHFEEWRKRATECTALMERLDGDKEFSPDKANEELGGPDDAWDFQRSYAYKTGDARWDRRSCAVLFRYLLFLLSFGLAVFGPSALAVWIRREFFK